MFDITKLRLKKGTLLKEPIHFVMEDVTVNTFKEYALIAVYPSEIFITKEVEKLAADAINAGFDAYKVFKAITVPDYDFDDFGVEYISFKQMPEAKEAIRKLTEEAQRVEEKVLEEVQEDDRKERFLNAIMETYRKEDLCMDELLDGMYANGFSVREMAEVYARAMYLANGDKCFIIKENERHPMWIW